MSLSSKLSVITPIYNEAKGLPELVEKISSALRSFPQYEIIAIDDGSKDNSADVLSELAQKHKELKVVLLARNYGQTTALAAGIARASGDILILIDSDLENNPEDIAAVIQPILDNKADVVSGWRKDRWANDRVARKLPSRMANGLISKVTGVNLHDYGCTLKAYRREFIQNVPLYGEMHRFIPAYAVQVGARVAEVPVGFTPRKYGKSNYGLSRLLRVLPDLLLFYFFSRFMQRPIHFFGYLGFLSFVLAAISLIIALWMKYSLGTSLIQTPLPILSGMSVLAGIQFFGFGLLAEVLMRTYFESQRKETYHIRKTFNL